MPYCVICGGRGRGGEGGGGQYSYEFPPPRFFNVLGFISSAELATINYPSEEIFVVDDDENFTHLKII